MLASRRLLFGLAFVAVLGGLAFGIGAASYPSDRTPEGAYLRIVQAVNQDRPQDFFAYTDEEAQHACYSVLDNRRRARARIQSAYPQAKQADALLPFQGILGLEGAPDVFAYYARREGWLSQLRHDLSAIKTVEQAGPRATIVTVVGTRYSLRRRPNGIYGLSAFTPFLREEAEKSARDFVLIDKTAADYEALRRP